MTTARLFSATAAVAVGLALLSSGSGSVAGWYDELEIPGATITSGELMVEERSTSVTMAGTTVVVEATSQLQLEGDALAADLALDVEGFTRADSTTTAGLTVQLESTDERLGGPGGTWRVDETFDDVTVTARITLPADEAKALTGEPRVTWSLTQAAPGQGWFSEAGQVISFAGVWPTVPVFPEIGCTPSPTAGSITIVWTWEDPAPVLWEIVEYNGAGNKAEIVETIEPDGRVVYSATVDTQNGIWLYAVRGTYADGTTVESPEVTLTSCAAENQIGG